MKHETQISQKKWWAITDTSVLRELPACWGSLLRRWQRTCINPSWRRGRKVPEAQKVNFLYGSRQQVLVETVFWQNTRSVKAWRSGSLFNPPPVGTKPSMLKVKPEPAALLCQHPADSRFLFCSLHSNISLIQAFFFFLDFTAIKLCSLERGEKYSMHLIWEVETQEHTQVRMNRIPLTPAYSLRFTVPLLQIAKKWPQLQWNWAKQNVRVLFPENLALVKENLLLTDMKAFTIWTRTEFDKARSWKCERLARKRTSEHQAIILYHRVTVITASYRG